MPPFPRRDELRATMSLAFARAMVGLFARVGDPAARVINFRPLDDPYPDYERLRAAGPLVHSKLGAYFTVAHDVTGPMLRDSEDWGVVAIADLTAVTWEAGMAHPVDHSLLAIDPPEHTAQRRVLTPWFTPRAVRRREELVTRTVADFLDRLGENEQFDLVSEFAARVPIRVISEMLGVDDSRYADFVRWGAVLGGTLDGVQSLTEWRGTRVAVAEMTDYFGELIARRRADPGEDIISALVEHDEEFDARGLVAVIGLLLIAGFETTRGLISNAMLAFLADPEQIRALRADPSLAANAVEETLRYDSPVQYTMRAARRDLEVAGTPLRSGEMVVTLLGGANRDPAVFDDPARFDITRANARDHLSFSAGAHYCLGAGLARMESEIALRELLLRFPNLRAAAPARRRPLRLLRGMESMPIDVGVRASVIS